MHLLHGLSIKGPCTASLHSELINPKETPKSTRTYIYIYKNDQHSRRLLLESIIYIYTHVALQGSMGLRGSRFRILGYMARPEDHRTPERLKPEIEATTNLQGL